MDYFFSPFRFVCSEPLKCSHALDHLRRTWFCAFGFILRVIDLYEADFSVCFGSTYTGLLYDLKSKSLTVYGFTLSILIAHSSFMYLLFFCGGGSEVM